jgi:molybdenum cofactor cytidylyltransferase
VTGRRRNPVIFDRRYFASILALRGDTGARAIVDSNPEDTLRVEFAGEGPFLDVDRPADMEGIGGERDGS